MKLAKITLAAAVLAATVATGCGPATAGTLVSSNDTATSSSTIAEPSFSPVAPESVESVVPTIAAPVTIAPTTAAPSPTQLPPAPVEQQAAAPTQTYVAPLPSNAYTNVDGNVIPGPQSAAAQPAGATAKCNDGTWSFSQHHQGTCSHHGGVAYFLN
jgi:hypothetical protein